MEILAEACLLMDHVARQSPIHRSDLEERLRAWSEHAGDSEWIGSGTSRGQQAWVHVVHAGRIFALNADTTGGGVREYLRLASTHPDLPWTVVENRNGRANKVAFGSNETTISKFYLYALDDP